jgi:hypothetical protein
MFKFSVPKWTPNDVLTYWEKCHEELEARWRTDFLNDSYSIAICEFHPDLIRAAIRNNKKIRFAYEEVLRQDGINEEKTERLLDERHPSHAIGITNAHHGDRTTDPFDTGNEKLLFKCERCNLKLSIQRQERTLEPRKVCIDCADHYS